MRLIDVHVHYTGDLAALDACVERWQGAGITQAVLFGINAPDGAFASLEAISAAWKRHPDFVVPFAYLNPGHHDCLAELDRAIAMGFKGAKLIFPSAPYDADEFFPIYERAAKAGMVLLFHTGIVAFESHGQRIGPQSAWRVSSNYMRPVHLDRIGRSFPEMKIIGAHLGTAAWYAEACHVMRWVPNIYFDLVIGQFHYVKRGVPEGAEARAIKPQIQELYDTGALDLKKILFGTDGFFGRDEARPDWSVRTVNFELEALGATQEEKEAVGWRTAVGILGVA